MDWKEEIREQVKDNDGGSTSDNEVSFESDGEDLMNLVKDKLDR